MNKFHIYLILVLLLLIVSLAAYYFVFNIYEVTYKMEPHNLYADNQSLIKITTVPLNSFGRRAPFRHSFTTYEITSGRELIEIILEDRQYGILILKAKNITGKVNVFVKSEHSFLPSSFEINIYPNFAEKNL